MKARMFHFDRVRSVSEVWYGIVPSRAGRDHLLHLRRGISDSHPRSRQSSTSWISHRPNDDAKRLLRKRRLDGTRDEYQNNTSPTKPSASRIGEVLKSTNHPSGGLCKHKRGHGEKGNDIWDPARWHRC